MISSLCGCGDLFQADIAPLVSSAIINPYAVIITKSFMINFNIPLDKHQVSGFIMSILLFQTKESK